MALSAPLEVILEKRIGSFGANVKLDSRRVTSTATTGRASSDIPVGRFVARVTADDLEVQLPSSLGGEVTTNIMGAVPYTPFREETDLSGAYEAEDQMPIVREGEIYVETTTACVAGAQVFVRAGTAVSADDGKAQATVGAGATLAVGIDAVFDQTLVGAGTVRVKLNLP